MSLRGRYVIDRIKRSVSSYLKMPVPPYGEPMFWENVYHKMDLATPISPDTSLPEFDDTFEWGDIKLQDVLEYRYRPVTIQQTTSATEYASSSTVGDTDATTTFGQTIGVEPNEFFSLMEDDTTTSTTTDSQQEESSGGSSSSTKEPIIMLGCGNSRMGEDMVEQGWQGPIIQVDIAAKALEMIARRSPHNSDRLQYLQEDATNLTSSIRQDTVAATIDKGLLDALFCADEYDQMTDIVSSVRRVLQPGGVFCIFSFSRPEFLLPRILPLHNNTQMPYGYGRQQQSTWEHVEVRELDRFMIYRLQKSKKGSNIREPKGYSQHHNKTQKRRQ
ncbi:Methyltransferase-like protein [Seminavis robusta]|uniref:Methyltransferase-like protein n=1 Tax=Seminavis robusta TaxID=568900 RepID=A0A9N8DHR3_9STRA|nr:Methyltransferase-like protein [Seminavis robusta]|eukprot:Sro164_g073660.1 Methyltransferase-like protein (331) ;mRNA; f:63533-64525